jgi:hypothetical protein
MSIPTYSYNITITIMQALDISMLIPSAAEICSPPFGCFGEKWPRVFGERMERRESICEGENY